MHVPQAGDSNGLVDRDAWLAWPARLRWIASFRRAVAAHGREIAQVIVDEIGKPESEAYVSEVLPLLAAMRWHARHARGVLRMQRATGRPAWLLGRSARVGRAPLGHVLIIATWNYPVGLLGVQLVQAVMAGNRVTVKPSERSTHAQRLLVRLAASCGLPEAWLVLADATPESGERLLREGAFDKVLFTGGTRVGRTVATTTAARLMPSVLELSGHDSAIVLADADVRRAAARIWLAITMNAGQTCMAPRRVLVDRSCYRAFLAALAPMAAGARPVRLVCAGEAERCVQLVREALGQGARSLSGVVEPAREGWMRPMVVADCAAASALVVGDHFGPVLAVVPVDGVAHALRVHDASRHRLAVGVYTRSVPRWRRDASFMMRLGASVITFNESVTPTGHPALTIAGSGGSGWGASRGAAGLLELSRPISVTETASWTPAAAPPKVAALRWLDRWVRWSHRARRVERLVSPPAPESACSVVQPEAAGTESSE